MQKRDYTDELGRQWRVLVPDGCPDDNLRAGIPVGPPSLDVPELEYMPDVTRVRLHNALYSRGILTLADLRRRPQDAMAALQAAYKSDLQTLERIYNNQGGT